jgi:hypothetical protein
MEPRHWSRTGNTLTYSVLVPPTMAVWAWLVMELSGEEMSVDLA